MNLHKNKEAFSDILEDAKNHLNIKKPIIEKDYFVTLFLKKIAQRQPDIIFKGGTSLSKCHRIINRFSEDIDLSIEPKTDRVTDSQRKKLKNDILEIIEEAGFFLENPNAIRSRRDLNRYVINYNSSISQDFLDENLIVETSVFIKPFPNELKETSSLIYDFLKESNADSQIEAYGLEPFEIKVQSLERTFADKIFAIADYYIDKKSKRLSRHIYDLYKIQPEISIDDTFVKLFGEVREVRKKHDICFSAQDGIDVRDILKRIVSEEYYKDDYKQITQSMLYEDVPYSTAITAIEKIIDSWCFG